MNLKITNLKNETVINIDNVSVDDAIKIINNIVNKEEECKCKKAKKEKQEEKNKDDMIDGNIRIVPAKDSDIKGALYDILFNTIGFDEVSECNDKCYKSKPHICDTLNTDVKICNDIIEELLFKRFFK